MISNGEVILSILLKLSNLSLTKYFVGNILYLFFAISLIDVNGASKTIDKNSYFVPISTAAPDPSDSP